MSRSLHTPGPKLRSKTPGRAASDVFGDQKKSSFAQSVASARQEVNEPTARTDSTMGFGIRGYHIAKHWRNDKIGPNIQNWKTGKLMDRGRHTYLDDVQKESKKRME